MQPQAVYGSDLSIYRINSQNIFVSADLGPYIDNIQVIDWVFSETCNLGLHT